MHFVKKVITIAILCGLFYAFLGYHYIIIGNKVRLLKKSQLTMEYTIFSMKGKTVESAVKIKQLWNDGIGDILVEEGLMSKEKLEMYKEQMEEQNNN